MTKVRLMDRPDDFAKLGINPDKVEPWEDGRRDTSNAGTSEVWYFDAILDDQTKVVLYFHTKSYARASEEGDVPDVGIQITTPDGVTHGSVITFYPVEESSFGTDKCDVRVGPHTVVGDFASYDIHIDPIDGTGADLHFEALVKPYRQGTAIIALGDDEEYHYTDLSVVKNKVTGTITVDGQTREVTGLGYHDHQWMNISQMQAWHHWLWGHLYTDNYTLLIYDFVASERYGFTKVPLFGVLDNATGEVIFQTDGNFTLETDLELHEASGKEFPKRSRYVFTNADGASVSFNTEWLEELEVRDVYHSANEAIRAAMDAQGISPVYIRYFATGSVTLNLPGQEPVTESGDMIYEYPITGNPDPRADV
ncbi:MAG: hypothetical protein VB036_15035 [Propionicimonas sp.]|nr:hypothetical protein [Propionicimonas sp.]